MAFLDKISQPNTSNTNQFNGLQSGNLFDNINSSEKELKLYLINKSKILAPQVFELRKIIAKTSPVSFDNLIVDTTSWISYSNIYQGTLKIGALPIPKEFKDQMIFLDQEFDYNDEMIWKLSHEMAHYITSSLNDDIKVTDFFNNIVVNSRRGGKGFSLIGSLDFYKNRGGIFEQASEDVTELTNMYLLHPNYLKNWLDFLSNVDDNFADHYKVQKIKPNVGDYIYQQIKYIVYTFIAKNRS